MSCLIPPYPRRIPSPYLYFPLFWAKSQEKKPLFFVLFGDILISYGINSERSEIVKHSDKMSKNTPILRDFKKAIATY
jgi:hypothetical protein